MIAAKQGRIFHRPEGSQCPVVDKLGDKWRVYYSYRDGQGRSLISYFETVAGNPKAIISDHRKPIIALGSHGSFDEHGMTPSCIMVVGGERYLYYTGWRKTGDTLRPYENAIGVIRVSRDLKHRRMFTNPIIPAGGDGRFVGHLMVKDFGTHCIGLHLSCFKWVDGEPYYDIVYRMSQDGLNWGEPAVGMSLPDGYGGICSSNLVNRETLVYCIRGEKDYRNNLSYSYRIEYATAEYGYWQREGIIPGLQPSASGEWDSEMICYPYVVTDQATGIKFLFYNGNSFGKTGIGYATLQA